MDRVDKLLYGSGAGIIAGLTLAARMQSNTASRNIVVVLCPLDMDLPSLP